MRDVDGGRCSTLDINFVPGGKRTMLIIYKRKMERCVRQRSWQIKMEGRAMSSLVLLVVSNHYTVGIL